MTPRDALDRFGQLYRKSSGASGGGSTQFVHLYGDCPVLRQEPNRIDDESRIPLRATICGRCENRLDRNDERPD